MTVSTAIPATKVGSVYRDAWRIYRRHPGALLVPGAVLFGVFGLPSALLSETTTRDGLLAVLLSLGAQTLGWTSSFLYYGYCDEVADQARTGDALGDLLIAPWAGMVISIVYFGLSGRGEPMPATGAAA